MPTGTDTALKIVSKTSVMKEGGLYYRFRHSSTSTKTDMIFGLFLPSCHPYVSNSNSNDSIDIPVLYWLSGLTCNDTNFAMKAGPVAFECAEKKNMAIVMVRNNYSL